MGNVLMFPVNVIAALIDKGTHYWVVYWHCYLYLTFIQRFKKPRLPHYDVLAVGEPEKQGFFIPEVEREIEWPKPQVAGEECDSAYCFGVNSKSECLSVRLTHVSESVVSCSLFLRLSDGSAYCLPEEHVNQVRTDEPDTFGSSRLKMQCYKPMRKWRIFFNGMLRKVNHSEDSTSEYKHIRIAMLFSPSAGVFDFTDHMSKIQLSDTVASSSTTWCTNPSSIFENITSHLNAYEHPGMLLGTVIVDNEQEQEFYLWGSRGHYTGDLRNEETKLPWKFYAQLENGVLIQIGEKIIRSGPIPKIIYGYIMRQNGFIYPIDSCNVLFRTSEEMRIACTAENYRFSIVVEFKDNPFNNQNLRQIKAIVDGKSGVGLLYLGREIQKGRNICEKELQTDVALTSDLSTPLWDIANSSSCVSGGKGSSLYHLYSIDKKTYSVPKGIIVTTSGYQEFMQKDLKRMVEELEKVVPSLSTQDLSIRCEKTVSAIKEAKLPESVRNSVAKSLEVVFKQEVDGVKFAVRSSATGEDTEQMSAAGQMDTYLGVKGIEQILDAVRKCWASQFAFVAVQYKRQYGQKLNTPMAVVIQEMVPCDVAGVAFSCDPLTGDPRFPSITANYGLGESVVSAAAEPDTIVLRRDLKDDIYIHSQQIGSKKMKIMMDETSGIKEIDLNEEESRECCISKGMALRLGRIVVTLEKKFGNPRDIEWGIKGDQIFLFQCRPVTSIDTETEFEIRHFDDSYIRTEDEYLSTANIGEVMPGALSPISIDLFEKLYTYYAKRHYLVKWDGEEMSDSLYYAKRIGIVNNHVLFCLLDAFFKFSEGDDEGSSDHTKAMTLALFGRIVDDPKMVSMSKERHSTHHKVGGLGHFVRSVIAKIYIIILLFFGGQFTKVAAKKIEKMKTRVKKGSTSAEILDMISKNYHTVFPAYQSHMDVTFSSPLWNHAVMNILVKANGEWNTVVFSDFAYLLSTLSNVESADVPSAIQALSYAIAQCVDKEEFSKMNAENALEWLRTSQSEAGRQFRQFLEKHGHRCLKEFDIHSKPWGTNTKPLVKLLQENVARDFKDVTEKKDLSYKEIFSKMTIKLGFMSRIMLRLILPHCRRGVREREISKSVIIKSFDNLRKLFSALADAMVAEGRLPNADLLYFLHIEEIRTLIETRSPRLVARTFRRWKCHPELDKLIFPEIMSGIPRPINMEEDVIETEDGFTMTGVPVSRGVVKATARVVLNLEDAKNIQPGDILITYSTDIGWSPYFPLLSGVVTELGGLISHGAVVAREYGLPCVVNLHGAIRAFKSGDYVLLNGTEGFLKKLKSA